MTKIVITAANGQLGTRIAHHLAAQGAAASVRLAARNPSKLAQWAEQGFETVRADYDDVASLDAAFAGADIVLLISGSPDPVDADLRKRQHRNAIAAAERAGVRRVVYTSSITARPHPGQPVLDDHYDTELALITSKLNWTILRNNIYLDIILEMILPSILQTGQYLTSSGKGSVAYVSRDDLARATAHLLLAPTEGNHIIDLAGTEAFNGAELVQLVSELTGRTVQHVVVSSAEHRAALAAAGLPPHIIEFVVAFDELIANGYFSITNHVIAELTGTPVVSAREFLSAHLKSSPAAAAGSH